jgi:hypothetical protein
MADLSFSPTYQDYLAYYGKNGDGALSQDQWNALTPAQQWQNVGSGMALAQSDPRYAALAQQLGVKNGGLLNLGYSPQSIAVNSQNYVDPNAVLQGNNVFATAHSNETPKTQFAGGGLSDKEWAILAASLVGGAALYGANAGWGATDAGGGGAASGASGGGFGANGTWTDIPTMDPVQAGTLNALGPDASQLATTAGASGGSSGLLGNLGSGASDLLGQAGTYIANNPLRALGLAQTAYGLLGGGSHGPSHTSTTSGGGGSKGGSGTSSFNLPQQQFYVNPYLQAQMNRGYGP